MEYCILKEKLPFFLLSKDNAKECLEAMGFGKDMCAKTYDKDGRYGRVTEAGIEFGFENSMNAKWKFGKYVVEDLNESEWNVLSATEFFEMYEPMKE